MRLFGRPAEATASAPGRVNLIGDHTDYNGGYVLPTALPQRTTVMLARREDRIVRAVSAQVPGVVTYALGQERRHGRWFDYVQGVTVTLATAGRAIDGFDLYVSSEVPIGGGLSSSAALEVALLRGLRELFSLALDDGEVAESAYRAETGFVGAPVGVMDPIVCSRGDERSALFIDTRSLAVERVPLPPELGLVVIDSGVHHRLTAAGGYRARRAECEEAAMRLGVPLLRDVREEDARAIDALPGTLARRVRHVMSENARVLAAAAALREGDLGVLGALFDESHRSLRDDFEVSIPEIDRLVELARGHAAVYGARLTGGGFGGSVVIVSDRSSAHEVAVEVAAAYAAATSCRPEIVLPRLRGAKSRS
ncbi:MAG TPA: galactokinase [Nannocystis sp.]